jgi:hypothetical protein
MVRRQRFTAVGWTRVHRDLSDDSSGVDEGVMSQRIRHCGVDEVRRQMIAMTAAGVDEGCDRDDSSGVDEA